MCIRNEINKICSQFYYYDCTLKSTRKNILTKKMKKETI